MPTATAPDPVRLTTRARQDHVLFLRYRQTADPAIRDEIVRRLLPFARSLARRYYRGDEPLDDLVQVASLGLVKAVDRFDPDRGVSFVTFAVPTIVGELKRHFRDRTWAVRPPRDLRELAIRIDRIAETLTAAAGSSPTVAQIAEAMDRDEESILEAVQARAAARSASLHAPRHPGAAGDASALEDVIGSDDHSFGLAEHRATLGPLLGILTERERLVVRLRYEEDMTQGQIGEIVGVSQMQVSRILRGALSRMHAMTRPLREDGDWPTSGGGTGPVVVPTTRTGALHD